MVNETSDVQEFLANRTLFNALSDDQLEFAANNIFIAFGKSGDRIDIAKKDPEGRPTGLIIVRTGSMEVRDANDELVDRLSSGDFIVPVVLADNDTRQYRIHVLEDCLYYELTELALQRLIRENPAVERIHAVYSRMFNLQPAAASSGPATHRPGEDSYLDPRVSDHMTRSLVCAAAGITIREAARLMKEHNVSSLMITDNDRLIGIVTDSDFRRRVLAEGMADSEPVSRVMTPSPVCVDADSRIHGAQIKMLAEGIHHMPVVSDGRPVGVLGFSDILRANNTEPLSLNRVIKAADSVDALSRAAERLPELVAKLVARDIRAVEIGEIISSITDGMTKRLIDMAADRLGEPPCEYAWMVFGSQARQEQVLGSDQDNALILDDRVRAEDDDYFKELAAFVNDGLDRCGIPRCHGEIMASNPKWRVSLSDWKAYFTDWIEQPSPKALMHASIFFDQRFVKGNRELVADLQRFVLGRARKDTIFLALMCDNSLQHSPPLGFFKTFVLETRGDHNKTLDLKRRGTIPIVDIARNYALAGGVDALNTLSRLDALKNAGAMSGELADSLKDAHEFIAGIRLEAQGAEYRSNRQTDNYLDPRTLSPLVRHQLKEAFHVVREAQNAMRARFGRGLL